MKTREMTANASHLIVEQLAASGVKEVDNVSVVSMTRGVEDFFASEVREYHLCVLRILSKKSIHVTDGRGDRALVSVVKSKTHSQCDGTLKTKVRVLI